MFIDPSVALRESNVEECSQMRVYFLLGKHSKYPGREQLLQEKFNAQFVESAWKEGDQLWVEESASLPPSELKKNQVRLLTIEGKLIKGWDHPEVCEKAERLASEILDLPAQEVRARKHQFVLDTFSERQQFLLTRIQNYIQENQGRLFIFAGEFHAVSKDPRFEPHATRLLEELRSAKISFSVFLFHQPELLVQEQKLTTVEKISSLYCSFKTYVESLWPQPGF